METKNKNQEKLTRQQQKALHLWFRQVAFELNREGITMQTILKRFSLEVPATEYNVKELWRILQTALLGKKSTTELLAQKDIDAVWDSLNKFFAEQFNLSIPPFPSSEVASWSEDCLTKPSATAEKYEET